MDKTPPQRGHALLTDKSPLTRALCKAAGLPDVEALMVALAHPMTDGDEEALVRRAGGHPAHRTRLKHLRKLAQGSGEEKTQKSLAKSGGAVAHHKLISLGHEGPGSRGGHPWWNENRNHGQGDWDYGPRPKGHRDIHEPLHPLHDEHRERIKSIEETAYRVGCDVNLPPFPWERVTRTKDQKLYLAHEKPIEDIHLQRLRDAWVAATAEHHMGGRDWYQNVYEMCQQWSVDTNAPDYEGRPLSADEIAMIIAVLSPRMPWEANINIAHNVVFGVPLAERGSDGSRLQDNHVDAYMNKARLVRDGQYPSLTSVLSTKDGQPQDYSHDELLIEAPKTYSFWRNMTNRDNHEAATADRHMFAILGANVDDRDDDMYHYAVRAMRQVATEKGVEPRVLQAVAWVWYEDHISSLVKETMRQLIKEREADNAVYSAYLREARGHRPGKKDPQMKELVALQHRKMEEEAAKLRRAEERATASERAGSPSHAAHARALETARAAVSSRQSMIDRHNYMIERALEQATTQKSFRHFRQGSCQTVR